MTNDKERRELVVPALEGDDDDDDELVALGYKPSFKREFTNISTVRYS